MKSFKKIVNVEKLLFLANYLYQLKIFIGEISGRDRLVEINLSPF